MDSVLIDNEFLAARLPEGFERIPHNELETMMGITYDCMWGVRDRARLMMVCITWKDSSKVLTKLVSEKAFAKQVNDTYRRQYRTSGYHCDEFFLRDVAGSDHGAHGFRFGYDAQGIAQSGEILVFKHGIRCYTMRYFTRTDVAEKNLPAYEAILDSLEVLRG
jgi:hypothetical protein